MKHNTSTISGNGNQGSQDGPANTSMFGYPTGVCVNSDGNIIVADTYHHKIRMINSNGEVSTISGNGMRGFKDGPSSTSKFAFPGGVCVDSIGNIIVSDTENHRIRMINSNGDVSTISENGESGFRDGPLNSSMFNCPQGICIDSVGGIIIADTENHRIRMINSTGDVSTISGSGMRGFKDGPSNISMFNYPHGVCVDSDGNIIVTDTENHRIRMINLNGEVSTICGTGEQGFKDGPSNISMFDNPCGVCVDFNGNIIVSDTFNYRIRMINSSGEVSTISGKGEEGDKDGPSNNATFFCPHSVCVDMDGNIIISDMNNHKIRKITFDVAMFEGNDCNKQYLDW